MKFCIKCGTPVPNDGNVCTSCGYQKNPTPMAVFEQPVLQVVANSTDVNEDKELKKIRKHRKNCSLWLILITFFSFCIYYIPVLFKAKSLMFDAMWYSITGEKILNGSKHLPVLDMDEVTTKRNILFVIFGALLLGTIISFMKTFVPAFIIGFFSLGGIIAMYNSTIEQAHILSAVGFVKSKASIASFVILALYIMVAAVGNAYRNKEKERIKELNS